MSNEDKVGPNLGRRTDQ